MLVRYCNGRLLPWPRGNVTPEIRARIKKHQAITRMESYAWAMRHWFYHSHSVEGLTAFEMVASYVFGFAGVREYYLMERHYRPPN